MESEHPSTEELVDFIRETLPKEKHRRVLIHCRACKDCGYQLWIISLLRKEAGQDSKKTLLKMLFFALAGAVVTLVAMFYIH